MFRAVPQPFGPLGQLFAVRNQYSGPRYWLVPEPDYDRDMTTTPTSVDRPAPGFVLASWRSWWAMWSSDGWLRGGLGWMQYVWTFLFNAAVAVAITAVTLIFSGKSIAIGEHFLGNLLFAQCVGFSIHLLYQLSSALIGRDRLAAVTWPWRVVYYCGVPMIGIFVGFSLAFAIMGRNIIDVAQRAPNFIVGSAVFSLVLSAILYQFFKQKTLVAEAEAGRERERARVNELERLAIDAKLRTLQAQIEPHFLFNTLANVASLIDTQPAQAQRMLERLIELLRASLTAARQPSATLAQEVRLLGAYLEILRLRMGDRLAYTIDVPREFGDVSIPPLSLQPLVENAIRHGLEPKLEGGHVRVLARAVESGLEVCVEDDGLGFAPRANAGFGLSNLRDRLAAIYGGRAKMSIEDRAPGTRIRISLPLEAGVVT